MSDLSLIVLSAGDSNRFKKRVKKQWIWVENKPLWLFVTDKLASFYPFSNIIVTSNEKELNYMQNFANYNFSLGGSTRQESLKNALEFVDTKYVLVTDVARSCIDFEMLNRVISAKERADCIVPTISVADTVVYNSNTIDRNCVKLVQTPQLSNSSKLKKALEQDIIYTDDSSAIKAIGGKVHFVEGSSEATKLTFSDNLKDLKCLSKPDREIFIGNGFDIHQFENNRDMYLGGVKIDVDYGFKAHSDGDVLIHSLIDSLLGAIGGGDIGELFPDTDQKYKNIDSKNLLKEVLTFIYSVGFEIVNVDITVIAEKPKLKNYKSLIRDNLSKLLDIDKFRVNIKATTSEKMGFIGRSEGVAVMSSASLKLFDWTKK